MGRSRTSKHSKETSMPSSLSLTSRFFPRPLVPKQKAPAPKQKISAPKEKGANCVEVVLTPRPTSSCRMHPAALSDRAKTVLAHSPGMAAASEMITRLVKDKFTQEAHLTLIRSSPGYAEFCLDFMDKHARLLTPLAKPVLIQEHLRDNPWKFLIAVMLLNKTAGRVAVPVFFELTDRWPTPRALANASFEDVRDCIRSLGLQTIRAKRLIQLSETYLTHPPVPLQRPCLRSKYFAHDSSLASRQAANFALARKKGKCKSIAEFTPISHLPGSGQYAIDSYRIYCGAEDEWKLVRPRDKELIRYLMWRWAVEGFHWNPDRGVVSIADPPYIERLVEQLIIFDPYHGA